MDDDKYQKVRDYALKLLSFRPRSTKEIKGKLMQFSIKRGISSKIVDQVINNLISQNFLNDKDFASWWLEQRDTFRPKGSRIIKMELLQKGIDRETIDQVLKPKKEENEEFNLALKVANKKILSYHHLPKEEIKIKIGNLLARRGFDWETIHKVIDSLVEKSYNKL